MIDTGRYNYKFVYTEVTFWLKNNMPYHGKIDARRCSRREPSQRFLSSLD